MALFMKASFYLDQVEQLETHKSCTICQVDHQCYVCPLWGSKNFYLCPTSYFQIKPLKLKYILLKQFHIDGDCIDTILSFFINLLTPLCVDNKNKIIDYRKNYLHTVFDHFTIGQLKDLIKQRELTCPKGKNKKEYQHVLYQDLGHKQSIWLNDYNYPLV
jgi:hypothetical protein